MHLRDGRGLLLDFGVRTSLRTKADRRRGDLDYIRSDAENDLGLNALLVRRDGIVAWATDADGGDDCLDRVWSRWFGDVAENA